MKEKKVTSLKIIFEDGSDYFAVCEKGMDKDEVAKYIERAFKPEPAEPLIKDEKKLDTVKSFFALLGITREIYYQSINNCFYHTDDDGITYGIDFNDDNGIDNICTGLPYSIDELCGEGEE